MRKLVAIIIILIIILLGLIVYKKIEMKNNNITIQEIEKIEKYIDQIYMWKEITKEPLPCFEEINKADENWIWEVVKNNLEDYEISHQQIQEKAKEIFGESFTKEFPNEGTNYLIYNEENALYQAIDIELDEKEEMFLLNEINKTEKGYEVEIIEYVEDYSKIVDRSENKIIIRNEKEEEIGKVNSDDDEKIKELVKSNIDKLNKKKIVLEKEDNKIFVKKVYQ